LGYRYFEVLMTDAKERKRFREEAIVPSKEHMIALGFPSFTVEDFYDNFLEAIDQLGLEVYTNESLHETFTEQGASDYLVVFLRLLTSMHLQKNADFFQNFLDNGKTVQEFCATEVEPMYQESDNIHIIALTAVTGIKVRIMYLDRGSNEEASPHDFPEDADPVVHLLYRPGHYDILYPK
jgi:ubiquitin thioesterase protein OTUB1